MADDEIEVEVVDEIPSPLDGVDEVIMGVRVEDLDRPVPASTSAPCAVCGRPVWVAPSSQLVLQHHDWPIACEPCVTEALEADDDEP